MSSFELPLDRLQRWMQSVVVHPGSIEEAMHDPPASRELAPDRLAEVIRPSASLQPAERVAIYQGMYPMRMEEALATDYPGLKHFLGASAFSELTRRYVAAHPSRYFSLNRLGDRLPEALLSMAGLRRREFCHDLARLEFAISQVFDGPETPSLGEPEIAAVPPEAWEGARLRPVAACRLLSFRYPVGAWLDSLDDEEHRHPPIRRRDAWAVVFRRDYSVYRLDLTRPAYELLTRLASGSSLGDAVGLAMQDRSRRKPREDELFGWFRQWVAAGVFASVDVAAQPVV